MRFDHLHGPGWEGQKAVISERLGKTVEDTTLKRQLLCADALDQWDWVRSTFVDPRCEE